ncbi:MAG: AraC family transcriptional regulator [Treponema sp.]|nr:AraC family transcriptional regulator [Treponema sp.]
MFNKNKSSLLPGNATAEEFIRNLGSAETLLNFLDFFPYIIQIFTPAGLLVFLNRSACEDMNIADAGNIIGNYNINSDPAITSAPGMKEFLGQVFRGETHTVSGVRISNSDPAAGDPQTVMEYNEVKFRTITGFPVYGSQREIQYITLIFQNTQMYRGRKEIILAQEYMIENWYDEFDLEKTAKNSNLSPFHFSRLFKQLTGVTPYTFYRQIKISKIKEKICDPNLNVPQAFDVCGVPYRGKYFRYFRDFTGMTPMEYRQSNIDRIALE